MPGQLDHTAFETTRFEWSITGRAFHMPECRFSHPTGPTTTGHLREAVRALRRPCPRCIPREFGVGFLRVLDYCSDLLFAQHEMIPIPEAGAWPERACRIAAGEKRMALFNPGDDNLVSLEEAAI